MSNATENVNGIVDMFFESLDKHPIATCSALAIVCVPLTICGIYAIQTKQLKAEEIALTTE